ncbi:MULTISPECIES: YbaK/EbsC family protein [Arthrobacter]|uniref:YbaK/EbsC family protein n=2 Tax=Arthrobacter TaxID=1663 RepID=A0ABU9KIJ6_9MICC|nr:YbaK/EbsC family protein [Arthrobacter sp. YJM1]MDP5225975.1 YbaK/EbsC family protein [Arthrobacter sp. YJM1]
MDTSELPERSQIVLRNVLDAGLDTRVRELSDSAHTAVDAARLLGCEVGAIASSLLFIADGDPVLVMTSGRHRVDLPTLATAIGAIEVRMANAKEVRSITGQAIGGVAPVGHPRPISTVVDSSLGDYEQVWTAAGTPHTVMPLTFDGLIALTKGTVLEVS